MGDQAINQPIQDGSDANAGKVGDSGTPNFETAVSAEQVAAAKAASDNTAKAATPQMSLFDSNDRGQTAPSGPSGGDAPPPKCGPGG